MKLYYKIPKSYYNYEIRFTRICVQPNFIYVEPVDAEQPVGENAVEITEEEFLQVVAEHQQNPSEQDLVNAEILLNQADILAKQNEQDEVLAEILLNQMEV